MVAMWRRIRGLLAIEEQSLEFVFVANAAVAIVTGTWAFLSWEFELVHAAELTAGIFFVLTACLLSKHTAIVAAVAGGLFSVTFAGGIGWGFGMRAHPVAGYAGMVFGAALGLSVAYRAYGAVFAGIRDRERHNQPRKTGFIRSKD